MDRTGTITEIKNKHILYGHINDCRACPTALALIENGYPLEAVQTESISYYDKNKKPIAKYNTIKLQEKIMSIDNSNVVAPFKIKEYNNRFSIYKEKQ